MQQEEQGPKQVAEEFLELIDNNDFNGAGELIHPNSVLNGPDDAADIIISIAGVGEVIDAIDISVAEATLLDKTDTRAVVRLTAEINVIVDKLSTDIPIDMRTHEGDWHVWNVNP